MNGFRDFDSSSAYRKYSKKTVPLVCCRQVSGVTTKDGKLDPVDEKLCQAAADTSKLSPKSKTKVTSVMYTEAFNILML